jgi:uncharacterized membrane protein YkgB
VTGLLPDTVKDALHGDSVYSASESFGVVTLVLLILLLLELEALRAARAGPARMVALSAVIAPLFVAVLLTIAVRIAQLIP